MHPFRSLLLLIAVALISIIPAGAQGEVKIGTLEIALWPEYDQPTMLVIYRLTLSADTLLPAQLSIRIPATAGRPNAVAVREPSGQLVNLEYELTSDGTWSTIRMVANFPELQIEFYDPGLIKEGNQRKFTFAWSGDYAVERCFVEVQQPLGASEMMISPGPARSEIAEGGLVYFMKEVGYLDNGQKFNIDLSYQKSGDDLSVSGLQVQPSAPLTAETGLGDRMLGALPWFLGTAGVLLIAGGVIWYWKSGQQSQPVKQRRGRGRRSPVERDESETLSGPIYCHQCGRRAAESDRFCRTCGTRLRVE
jgi:hypothetical protein